MMTESDHILFPIITEETLKIFMYEVEEYNIIRTPLLKIHPKYDVIRKLLSEVDRFPRDRVLSIFTSKNGVKVVLNYLMENSILDKYLYLFRHVACIGPFTMEYLLKYLLNKVNGFKPLSILIPHEHNSISLSKLLKDIDLSPILWASTYVNNNLRNTVSSLGGLIGYIYDISLEKDKLEELLYKFKSIYRKFFFVFMSVKALESIDSIRSILNTGIYGIFISDRVFKAADTDIFKRCYVYNGQSINGFYKFIQEVVKE